MSAPAPAWRRMAAGTVVRLPFRVTEADLDAFARLSGDLNPLHLDAAFARARGFKGRVVYGGLMIAAVSRLLGTKLPGAGCLWQELNLQFTAPLYAGERAAVVATVSHASPEMGVVRLSLELKCGKRLLARGRAQAQLKEAR